MLIFGRMQNCVKRQMDTCFPVQNTQFLCTISGSVYKGGRTGQILLSGHITSRKFSVSVLE